MSGILKRLLKASGIPQQGVGLLWEGHSIASLKGIDQPLLDAIYSLGHQNYQSERFVEARKIMRYLCVHDHRNAEYLAALGACEYRLGNYAAALGVLEQSVSMNPSDPRSLLNLALCLIKSGRKKEARAAMRVAEGLARDQTAFRYEWKLASRILEGRGKQKQSRSED
ncbi:MAG: tetratricopeptide repeat protein [Kistimonas sp.]|nr:tetratricopeptide repeat protein [Kistimonas sp.]